ncbi:MAG: hypothetical protein GXP23_11485 [Gammaproteobacteria bacterium]|nr:hypothetical protein [Gammaproteobacteria bacterium]
MNTRVFNAGYRYWVFFLLTLGVFLRTLHYIGDRSLWMDEAKLALNFVQFPTWSIFHPLLNNQIAPVGFLLIEKLVVGWFGVGEMALRFYPFVAGVASVFLIYKLANRIFGIWIGLMALGIFAISHWAIYYAAEVKQYSSDMMVALILYIAAAYALEKWNTTRWVVLTAAGIVGVWLSHPATFILAGIGISIGVQSIAHKQWNDVARLAISAIIWFGAFAVGLYATATIGSGATAAGSATFSHMTEVAWTSTFAPFPPMSLSDTRWYWAAFFRVFNHPLGFATQGLAAFLFLAGIVHLWARNCLWLGFLVLPMLVALLASALHLYPFSSRLLIFLVPGTIIIIAAGIETLRQLAWDKCRPIWFLAIAVLLLQPAWEAFSNATHKIPYDRENIRAVLEYINQTKAPDDWIYVYARAGSAFRYYRQRFAFPESHIIQGNSIRASWDAYLGDVNRIRCFKRVWLVFSHIETTKAGVDEERYLLHSLDKIGEQLDTIKASEASGYLYRFDPDTSSESCDSVTLTGLEQ